MPAKKVKKAAKKPVKKAVKKPAVKKPTKKVAARKPKKAKETVENVVVAPVVDSSGVVTMNPVDDDVLN